LDTLDNVENVKKIHGIPMYRNPVSFNGAAGGFEPLAFGVGELGEVNAMMQCRKL